VLILSFTAITASVGCSKKEKAASKGADLTKLLPKGVLGFVVADGQSPGFADFLQRGWYKSYIENLKKQLSQNTAQTGDFSTYFEVLKELGLYELNAGEKFPFGQALFFGVPDTAGAAFAGYYEATADSKFAERLASVRAILTKKSFQVSDLKGEGYEGFSVKIFEPEASLAPAMTVYRDQLGISNAFFAFGNGRLAISTNKELLERGFAAPKDESKELLEGAAYKKIRASLPESDAGLGFGVVDVGAIAKLSKSPVPPLPLSLVGIQYDSQPNGMIGRVVTDLAAADAKQKEVLDLFASTTGASGQIFARVTEGSAFGLSVDGALLLKMIEMGTKGAPLPPEAQQLKSLLSSVGAMHLSVAKAKVKGMLPIPDITLAMQDKDAPKLLAGVRELVGKSPLPPGFAFQEVKDGALTVYSMPTPVGVSVNLASIGDTVFLTTSKDLLTQAAADISKIGLKGAAAATSGMKSPRLGLYVDYSLFGDLMVELMQMQPGAANNPALAQSFANFESMKNVGKVALALEVTGDQLRLNMSQEYGPAK